eukprot:jgi/Ulvmu1/1568/UM110_0031.1
MMMIPCAGKSYLLCIMILCNALHGADARSRSVVDVASVTTPSELQKAVRSGVQHVIINNHIDMTKNLRVEGSAGPPADAKGPLSIQQNANGQYTKTIRGNCTQALEGGPLLLPLKPQQCVITVLKSFLDVALDDSLVWLSDLYISVSGQPRDGTAATLITARGRALYMTNMTLSGNGATARAVHVMPRGTLFFSESLITSFTYQSSAVLRLEAGARATMHRTTFSDNCAGVGPVAGLRSTSSAADRIGAVVWFHECRFIRNVATHSDAGLVDVEDTRCYIYSDQRGKDMWMQFCRKNATHIAPHCRAYELGPRRPGQAVSTRGDSSTLTGKHGVFAHVAAAAQPLPRSSDAGFQQISAEQAARSGLAVPQLIALPAGTDLVSKPYRYQCSAVWIAILVWCNFGFLLCISIVLLRGCMRPSRTRRMINEKAGGGADVLDGKAAVEHGVEASKHSVCSRDIRCDDPGGMPAAAVAVKVHSQGGGDSDFESIRHSPSLANLPEVPPPLLETLDDTVDTPLTAEAGVCVLARFKVNEKDSVAVFKATTKEDFRDVVNVLPAMNTPLPAKKMYLIARLELRPADSIQERLALVNEQNTPMAAAVGPAVACLMATFGTNMIPSCIFEFDDPVELKGVVSQKRMEMWGLQIPHNAVRTVLKDEDPEALPGEGGEAEEQLVVWSSVDRLNISCGLLYALCVSGHDSDVSCGFCMLHARLLKRWQRAGVRMKEVTTKKRFIYPPHAHDYEFYASSTVAFFLVDDVRAGLRNKLTLLE